MKTYNFYDDERVIMINKKKINFKIHTKQK